MAMTILNNASAIMTLGELNKNINKVGKALSKVSTGQRIVGASDDTATYSISERMRALILGLNQSGENVKKGINIIDMAERAVGEQVEIVRRMREIAMKASDAACSQEDRDVLQSELSQLGDQLEDIAMNTTYNGIELLNGVTAISDAGATRFFNFNAGNNATPNNFTNLFPETESTRRTSNGGTGVTGYTGIYGDGQFEAKLDFSNAIDSNGNKISTKNLNGQGFTVACGGCEMSVSIIFDAGRQLNTSEYIASRNDSGRITFEAYVVGIKDAETFEEVYESIFKGVAKANDNNTLINMSDSGTVTQISNINSHRVQLHKEGNNYFLSKAGSPTFEQMVVYNGIAATFDTESILMDYDAPWKSLRIQGDTKASMYTNVQVPNTTLKQLFVSVDESKIDSSCVRTWENAKDFVAETDDALNYLLDAATTLGAQARRLQFTNDNITVSTENTQAAESAMRDADMAKEMTAYTKFNVLAQASQSMLAQANQTSSSVLSLLQ